MKMFEFRKKNVTFISRGPVNNISTKAQIMASVDQAESYYLNKW